MAKSINIPLDEYYNTLKAWFTNFTNSMDSYEEIAVGTVSLGFILLIVGIILL